MRDYLDLLVLVFGALVVGASAAALAYFGLRFSWLGTSMFGVGGAMIGWLAVSLVRIAGTYDDVDPRSDG